MSVIDCSKCVHCGVCGNRYANDGYTGECSYFLEHNPTGDCISREALKKAIEEVEDNYDGYEPNDLGKFMCKVDDLIDNAQAVDLWQLRQEATENALKKAEVLYGRPQGEWVGNAFDEHHCNRCGHPALWEEEPDGYYEVQSRFCPNCGTDMRKGGA